MSNNTVRLGLLNRRGAYFFVNMPREKIKMKHMYMLCPLSMGVMERGGISEKEVHLQVEIIKHALARYLRLKFPTE